VTIDDSKNAHGLRTCGFFDSRIRSSLPRDMCAARVPHDYPGSELADTVVSSPEDVRVLLELAVRLDIEALFGMFPMTNTTSLYWISTRYNITQTNGSYLVRPVARRVTIPARGDRPRVVRWVSSWSNAWMASIVTGAPPELLVGYSATADGHLRLVARQGQYAALGVWLSGLPKLLVARETIPAAALARLTVTLEEQSLCSFLLPAIEHLVAAVFPPGKADGVTVERVDRSGPTEFVLNLSVAGGPLPPSPTVQAVMPHTLRRVRLALATPVPPVQRPWGRAAAATAAAPGSRGAGDPLVPRVVRELAKSSRAGAAPWSPDPAAVPTAAASAAVPAATAPSAATRAADAVNAYAVEAEKHNSAALAARLPPAGDAPAAKTGGFPGAVGGFAAPRANDVEAPLSKKDAQHYFGQALEVCWSPADQAGTLDENAKAAVPQLASHLAAVSAKAKLTRTHVECVERHVGAIAQCQSATLTSSPPQRREARNSWRAAKRRGRHTRHPRRRGRGTTRGIGAPQ
jgi:hypothetical protein